MKDSYISLPIELLISSQKFNDMVGKEWTPEDQRADLIDQVAHEAFVKQGYEIPLGQYRPHAKVLFDVLQSEEAILIEGDEYTGLWFKFDLDQKHHTIQKILRDNEARARVQNLGPDALARALQKIALEDGLMEVGSDADSPEIRDKIAPASDRIVNFDHNSKEAQEIDIDLEAVTEIVRGDNEARIIPEPEKRRILEQFGAARELLKVGRVSSRAIYGLVVPALIYLSTKFADEAVGELAGKLLEALTKMLGI